MARAALRIGVRELAAAAKVSTNTITRFEQDEPLRERTVAAIQASLEALGVEFLLNGQPGIRVKRSRLLCELVERFVADLQLDLTNKWGWTLERTPNGLRWLDRSGQQFASITIDDAEDAVDAPPIYRAGNSFAVSESGLTKDALDSWMVRMVFLRQFADQKGLSDAEFRSRVMMEEDHSAISAILAEAREARKDGPIVRPPIPRPPRSRKMPNR
jgi:transcriptional regulator with XRE-family HTH domain